MTERPTFAQIVAAAKCHTPGGRLNAQDREGLTRRGTNMGLTEVDIRTVLDQVPPGHPVTRGIE